MKGKQARSPRRGCRRQFDGDNNPNSFLIMRGRARRLSPGQISLAGQKLAGPPFSLLRAGKIIAKAKVIQNARSKMGTMAENHAHPAGPPAMNYAEHEKLTNCFSSS